MKNTFEETASHRLEETTIPFPIHDLLHVPVFTNIPEILQYRKWRYHSK
jgi:hypothetical protein